MEFTASEYYMYKGIEHGRVGSLAMLEKIMDDGPMFITPRTMMMFDSYVFGYLIGLGYKGVYYV